MDVIDACGLSCPLPLLKLKQGLNKLAGGECLQLLATDPGSERDVQTFARLSGHELVSFQVSSEGVYQYVLRKH